MLTVAVAAVAVWLYTKSQDNELVPGSTKCQEILSRPDLPNAGIDAEKAKCMGQI
jgi:hypothetical protein